MNKSFQKLFKKKIPIVGMIHTLASPGSPKYSGSVNKIIIKAIEEANIYKEAGVDAIAIENMHDLPYLNRNAGPEVISIMSIVGYEVKLKTNLPTGIQILAGANKEALACAKAAKLDFIRAEGFVFSHIADEGFMNSDAGELMRYRRIINAENILVFADIKKKHSSHNITNDVSIEETAKAAEFFLSDGLIITGTATGKEANILEIKKVKNSVKLPVFIGSGITFENVDNYFQISDGLIIGSYFKKNGIWKNSVDYKRVTQFMKKIQTLRKI